MMMCIQNLVSFCQFVLKTLNKNQILTSIKGRNPVANLGKTMIYITSIDLVNDNEFWSHFVLKILSKNQILTCIKGRNNDLRYQSRSSMCMQNLVSVCLFFLKILSKNQILTSIKGRKSDANLQKTMIYYTNIDLVNDNMYTKFGHNQSICFHLISIKGRNSVANLPKFELIQAFMHVLVTCNNEEDPIQNEGTRVFTGFLPL